MKRFFSFLVAMLLFLPNVEAFSSSASCSILMDMDSHRILYAENMHTVRSVASISKIMTAVLAIDSGKLEEEVTVSDVVLKAYGSGIYIQVGEHLKLKDLVYGLMLRSGNDAALQIAEYVGGSVEKFVEMMNEKAKELGMKDSTFHNPSGLDEEDKGNLSSAYDMAILTSYAMQNQTYQKIVKTKKYRLKTDKNTYLWNNKNKLLSLYSYTTGGKTGYTEIAKRTLVSTASKDGLHLVAVTLNDGNDWEDHQSFYEEAYQRYQKYDILKEGNIDIIGETYYMNHEFYIKENFSYPLNQTEKDIILLKFALEKKGDFQEGEEVGKVSVLIGEKEVFETSIYAKEIPKEKESWWDCLIRWFRSLW